MSVSKLILPLHNMSERHPGLTPAIAACYHQAARVCLDRHHTTPVDFILQENQEELVIQVEWECTDAQCRAAWANEIDTTEAGAYACTLAAVEVTKGLVAVHRAETGTGADYYIGPLDRTADDLEDYYRLEISGIDHGTISKIRYRLQQKVQQARAGNSNLPALAAVIGFQAQLILVQAVEDTA
jgi:hypothetical protein